jgi:hypothetical protein
MNKYSASFTSGALLWEETNAILPLLLGKNVGGIQNEVETGERLKINARKSRRSIVTQIQKRFESVSLKVWNFYRECSEEEQLMLLYFTAMKTYPLIQDFHLDVLLKKWAGYNLQWNKADVLNFLYRQSDKHPEIDSWTENTQNKIAGVIAVMLKEAGLLKGGKLQEPHLPDRFWQFFIEAGEDWFLEATFLSETERIQIIERCQT